MSTWSTVRTDVEFEKAFGLFVHLQDHAQQVLSLPDRLMLAEAFEEFTRHGADQVGQLLSPDSVNPHLEPATVLETLTNRLRQLLANASGLDDALRYTRALDLIAVLQIKPAR